VTDERFAEALRRARVELARGGRRESPERLAGLLADGTHRADPPATHLERLALRHRDRFVLLPVDEVRWIAAAANYVEIHARGRTYLMRTTLHDLGRRLDPARFVRIHRSTIVNMAVVRELRPEVHGDFDVILDDGAMLRMSRTHRDRLLPR
jgi:two-component system LytT family response regulator